MGLLYLYITLVGRLHIGISPTLCRSILQVSKVRYYIFYTNEFLDFVHHMVLEVILSIFYIKDHSNLTLFLKNYIVKKLIQNIQQNT